MRDVREVGLKLSISLLFVVLVMLFSMFALADPPQGRGHGKGKKVAHSYGNETLLIS